MVLAKPRRKPSVFVCSEGEKHESEFCSDVSGLCGVGEGLQRLQRESATSGSERRKVPSTHKTKVIDFESSICEN